MQVYTCFVWLFPDSIWQIAWRGYYGSYQDSEYVRSLCGIAVSCSSSIVAVSSFMFFWRRDLCLSDRGAHVVFFRNLHSWNHETGLDLHWLEFMRKFQRNLEAAHHSFSPGQMSSLHADGSGALRAPVAAAWRHAWGPSQQTFFVWVAWEVIDSFATSFLRLRKSFLFPDCETLHLRGSTSAIWSWFSSFYFLGWTPWIGARFSLTVTVQCSTPGVWFWPRP